MSIERKINKRTQRRSRRVRQKFGFDKPRVSVHKSLKYIYAQIIDDAGQKTVAHASSLSSQTKGDKTEVAHDVGLALAKKAKALGITRVAFDRGVFKYHGRVKSLADGLREGGLEF